MQLGDIGMACVLGCNIEIQLKLTKNSRIEFWRHCLPLHSQWMRFLLPDMFGIVSQVLLLHWVGTTSRPSERSNVPRSSFSPSFGASSHSGLLVIRNRPFFRCSDCYPVVPSGSCCRRQNKLIRRPQSPC